ncbi:class I SAM-dependent methyltransferase [Nocardioides dilutus]
MSADWVDWAESELITLHLDDWTHPADDEDLAILDLCDGPTLDVGCGPGRLTEALGLRGHVVLGIDVTPEAVGRTVRRGGAAIRRDVFAPLPGEGRWFTALLADGNVGIGGDPVALLHRLRQVLDPRGRVVVELAEPGTEPCTGWATLSDRGLLTEAFPWSVVGVDDIPRIAWDAGLEATGMHRFAHRWCAVLEAAA